MGQSSSSGVNEAFNLISIFFVALTIFVCAITFLIMGDVLPAGPFEPPTEAPTSTMVLVDGNTPTFTPSSTPPPSNTPSNTLVPTETPTWTPLPSNTATNTSSPTATLTPSTTPTFTASPTITDTPTTTDTPTASPTPTAPPPTLAPAVLLQFNPLPTITRDAFNQPGCQWQGAAGNITDAAGQPLVGIPVRITGPEFNQLVSSGTNTTFGGGGWELKTNDAPTAGTYFVQLLAPDLVTTVSNPIPLTFDGTCEGNLVLINFVRIN